MTNNDILRRIRYTFDYSDSKMMELFELADHPVSRTQISDWMKREHEDSFRELTDKNLAIFLNGFIIENRGKKDGQTPVPEDRLNNNIILRKLKIALALKSDDIIDMFQLINKKISPHELSAFLRNPKQNQYRPCNDQYLRNFMDGLQKKFRRG